MEQYDLAFGCGLQCGASMALRKAGLQFASYPFDWTSSPTFRNEAQMLADGFSHWLDREDLRLFEIRRGGINKHIYRNARTGFGFVHDFSSFKSFDETFPEVKAKYDRRIARLQRDLAKARRVLVLCIEAPDGRCEGNDELVEVRKILSYAVPQAVVDVVYFHVIENERTPQVEKVAEGVRKIGLDYRTWVDSVLDHTVAPEGVAAWLKENVTVPDPRSEEEKRRYADDWRRQDHSRWGTDGFLRVFIRRTAFRLYRKLERYLMREGLVPKERPIWGLWE